MGTFSKTHNNTSSRANLAATANFNELRLTVVDQQQQTIEQPQSQSQSPPQSQSSQQQQQHQQQVHQANESTSIHLDSIQQQLQHQHHGIKDENDDDESVEEFSVTFPIVEHATVVTHIPVEEATETICQVK